MRLIETCNKNLSNKFKHLTHLIVQQEFKIQTSVRGVNTHELIRCCFGKNLLFQKRYLNWIASSECGSRRNPAWWPKSLTLAPESPSTGNEIFFSTSLEFSVVSKLPSYGNFYFLHKQYLDLEWSVKSPLRLNKVNHDHGRNKGDKS